MKTAAIYVRVSTAEQTTDNQRQELERVAERAGWRVVRVYEDPAVSGSVRRERRPALRELLLDARRRRFDVVMAWSVDRLGRSLQDLVGLLGELQELGVDLFLQRQGVDTTTAVGKAMFGMLGVFAEFEREMIRERVVAGMARARRAGIHVGRPPVDAARRAAFLDALRAGASKRAARRAAGIGVSASARILAAHAPPA